MQSGAVSLVTELASGQMIESGMVGRDSIVGGEIALDDRGATYRAIVQLAGAGVILDIDTARRVARDSEEFRRQLIRHEQAMLAQAQQLAACNAAHNLQQRLARWLLRARDVTGGDTLLLTQEYIAEMLGVARTSVTIVAHALQESGLISYHRGHLKIEKPELLENHACECYRAIKGRYDQLEQSHHSHRAAE
jgi:CRP-like cAMP-binding protein